MRRPGTVSRAIQDALAVLFPTECSGCGAPDRALCQACRDALQPAVHSSEREGVAVWSALDYSGVARRVIGAFKDGGRTDAAAALAAPLRAAVAAAVGAAVGAAAIDAAAVHPAAIDAAAIDAAAVDPAAIDAAGIHLVTIPSSRRAWRTRGFHPVELLLARAGLAATGVLRPVGETIDQVGLGSADRIRNKQASLAARRPLAGFRCVIVDDIVTTGATVLEARRAVREAGGDVLGVATLAETRRRFPATSRSPQTH